MIRSVRLTQGRFLNWDAARQHLIVLGNPAINHWTHENVLEREFYCELRAGSGTSRRWPEKKKEYRTVEDPTGRVSMDYALISMSTGASGSRVLTLAGPAVSGTHAAGCFFTNPAKMKPVYERLKAIDSKHAFPSNWEVLIRTDVRENIPVDTAFVTCRAYAR